MSPQDAAAGAARRDLAMAAARALLPLWLGCLCGSLAQGLRRQQPFPELRDAVPGHRAAGGGPDPPLQPLDPLSEHMLRLYDSYSGGASAEAARTPGSPEPGSPPLRPQPRREGNTVRSFRAGAAGEYPRRSFSAAGPRGLPGPAQLPRLPGAAQRPPGSARRPFGPRGPRHPPPSAGEAAR